MMKVRRNKSAILFRLTVCIVATVAGRDRTTAGDTDFVKSTAPFGSVVR